MRPRSLERNAERLKHPRSHTFFHAKQPKQDVLGADVVVAKRPCLLLCEDDHLPCAFCKPLKHHSKHPTERKRILGRPKQKLGADQLRRVMSGSAESNPVPHLSAEM